jgi:hypothetical protein
MQAQQAGLQQQQQGSQLGTEQGGPATQNDPSEPGWQDTGSEDFMDAWSDDENDESEGYAADHASGDQEHDQLMQLQPQAPQQLQNHPQQQQVQQQPDQQHNLGDQMPQHQQGERPQDLEMQTQEDQQGQQQQQQQAGDLADLVLRLPPQQLQQFLLQLDEQGFDIADIEEGSEASSSGSGSSNGSQDQDTDELQPADTGTL